MSRLSTVVVLILLLTTTIVQAQQPNVTGLAFEPLELFTSYEESAQPVDEAMATDFAFPVPIKAASNNGMLLVHVKGKDYWVISDDVETDTELSLDAGCEPESEGVIVSFGARGLGEGC